MSTNKFEVGDKVKLVSLDVNNDIYVPDMIKHLGNIGVVACNCEFVEKILVDFGDFPFSFFYPTGWLKPVYWSGKFIVVGECQTKTPIYPKMQPVTVGKVYELKDGKATLDDGRVIQNYNYGAFNAFAARLRDFGAEIIEFKGFCKNEGKDHNE